MQSLEQRPVTEIFIEKNPNGNQADNDDDDDDNDDTIIWMLIKKSPSIFETRGPHFRFSKL